MKKIILALVAALTLATSAQAGLFSTASGMLMDEVKPQQSYTVDTAGINPRVYMFYAKGSHPKKQCLVLFTNSSSDKAAAPVMQCWTTDKQ